MLEVLRRHSPSPSSVGGPGGHAVGQPTSRPSRTCAGGGERACGGIGPGGRALDGRASLVKAACGMAAPLRRHMTGVGRSRKTARSSLPRRSASRVSAGLHPLFECCLISLSGLCLIISAFKRFSAVAVQLPSRSASLAAPTSAIGRRSSPGLDSTTVGMEGFLIMGSRRCGHPPATLARDLAA